jgi:hypothetical protein
MRRLVGGDKLGRPPRFGPHGEECRVEHKGLRVDRHYRFVFFGVTRAGEHLENPLPQRDAAIDDHAVSLGVDPCPIAFREAFHANRIGQLWGLLQRQDCLVGRRIFFFLLP